MLIPQSHILEITKLGKKRIYSHQIRKKYLLEIIQELLPKKKAILDVGSACGDIAVELANLGYHVLGIEKDYIRVNKAKALAEEYNLQTEFICGRIEEVNLVKKYDLILLGESLEHFFKPWELLNKLTPFLNEGGLMLLTVPNMPSLKGRLKFSFLGIFPDNDPNHHFYYDEKRLRQILKQTSLSIQCLKIRFFYLFSYFGADSLLRKFLVGVLNRIFSNLGDTIVAVLSKDKITRVVSFKN